MKILTYKNSLGVELKFSNTAPLILNKLETSNNVNIYSTKGMSQDGETYLANTLDKRDITLEITIIASTVDELINYKDKLNKLFNPKNGEGWLIYKDSAKERKIKCIVNNIPFFTDDSNTIVTCLISLTANNPFWIDLSENKTEIALWKGDFEFPLEIPSGGIELGHREPSLIVNVFNSGDVECGMRIEFKALGTLTNPSLFNVNTREYIKINKTMTGGEIISVSTYFGDKRIESTLNGVTTNAFNYIDFQSTFLQLHNGDNLFRYNADSGLDNLEVNVWYHQQYLGV